MTRPVQIFRLVSKPTDPGLFCGRDELTLGGAPLLTATRSGLGPRPTDELQEIFDTAYGSAAGINAESRLSGLRSVARALDDGDLFRATVTSLMLRLPEIDPVGMARLARTEELFKFGYNTLEPRDRRGRWTGGAGENPNIRPVQAGALPIPLPPLVGGLGAPKPNDDDDWDYPAAVPKPSTGNPADGSARTDAHAAANDNQPKACPDPGYESSSIGRTREQLLYQAQINKLPPGMSVFLNGVDYDGCRESDQTMLEAKYGDEWLLTVPLFVRPFLKEYRETMEQAFWQNQASGGRRVEWHFMNPFVANYWAGEFKRAGYSNITVRFTPYLEKYNYNFVRGGADADLMYTSFTGNKGDA